MVQRHVHWEEIVYADKMLAELVPSAKDEDIIGKITGNQYMKSLKKLF